MERKPIKCKVLRPFYVKGEVLQPEAVVELDYILAKEMKASNKVEFVSAAIDPVKEVKEVKEVEQPKTGKKK